MVDGKSQIEHSISQVRKRDGSVSDFNRDKILNAIYKAFTASNKLTPIIVKFLKYS